MRKVTQAEFDAIECNGCGRCCNPVQMMSPHAFAVMLGRIDAARRKGIIDPDHERFVAWVSDLEPLQRVNDLDAEQWDTNCYEYKCHRYDPLALRCTRYDDRPWVCSSFPYGRPVAEWEECSWHVEVVDAPSQAGPVRVIEI